MTYFIVHLHPPYAYDFGVLISGVLYMYPLMAFYSTHLIDMRHRPPPIPARDTAGYRVGRRRAEAPRTLL